MENYTLSLNLSKKQNNPTYINKLNSILHNCIQSNGDILNFLMLIHRVLVVPQFPLLQDLHQSYKLGAILEICLQVVNRVTNLFEIDIDPILEGVSLNDEINSIKFIFHLWMLYKTLKILLLLLKLSICTVWLLLNIIL